MLGTFNSNFIFFSTSIEVVGITTLALVIKHSIFKSALLLVTIAIGWRSIIGRHFHRKFAVTKMYIFQT